MGQTESNLKNNKFQTGIGGTIDNSGGGSQNFENISYTNFSDNNRQRSNSTTSNNSSNNNLGISGGSMSKSSSANEIITINHLERKEEFEPELNILYNTPIFYPLLTLEDDEEDDDNINELGEEERFIRYLKRKHHGTIPDMDQRGYLNLCIDIQNYLKNSTGYIHEKQNEILQKIRDVEVKQAKKITNILQIKTSDATNAQFGVKEVLDKVKGNLDKSKEIIFKISDLIEKIEACLPPDDVKEIKDDMMVTFGPLTSI